MLASPVIDGDRVKLIDNDITSRGGSNCVTVRQGAQDVEIRHNRIHNCSNGVRLDKSGFTVVESNLIYRNLRAGVRVYPDADNTSVLRNIIDRNADNVVIGGNATSPSVRSDGSDVFQNITSNPRRFNLTDDGGTMGNDNLFRSNCVYKPGDAANGIDDVTSSSSVSGRAWASDTSFGDPRYVATRGPNAYRLQGSSPCRTLAGVEVDFAVAANDDARPSQVEAINLRPNIVFIVTDDQRADTMHLTPHVMPNALKWFRDGDPAAGVVGGTEYVNAFATTPLCCPARASIFSGRYAHNHEVVRNSLGNRAAVDQHHSALPERHRIRERDLRQVPERLEAADPVLSRLHKSTRRRTRCRPGSELRPVLDIRGLHRLGRVAGEREPRSRATRHE